MSLLNACLGLYSYRKAGDKCSFVIIFHLEFYIHSYKKDIEIAHCPVSCPFLSSEFSIVTKAIFPM